MGYKKQYQINHCNTEIHSTGSICIIVLQKNCQCRHKDHDYAGFHCRHKIPCQVPSYKILLNVRKQKHQHVDDHYHSEAFHQLGLHIYYRHIPVTHQPQITSEEIADDKTYQIRQKQHHCLDLFF